MALPPSNRLLSPVASQQQSQYRSAAAGRGGGGPTSKLNNHVKKPLNAFMIFMKEQRPVVVAECTLKESAAINQILGRKWHSLSRDEQAKYYELARKEKELHSKLYPNWSARENYGGASRKKKKKKLGLGLDGDAKNLGASAKKCRAVYGLDRQELWCKPCKRKKKCVKFAPDSDDGATAATALGGAGGGAMAASGVGAAVLMHQLHQHQLHQLQHQQLHQDQPELQPPRKKFRPLDSRLIRDAEADEDQLDDDDSDDDGDDGDEAEEDAEAGFEQCDSADFASESREAEAAATAAAEAGIVDEEDYGDYQDEAENCSREVHSAGVKIEAEVVKPLSPPPQSAGAEEV
ncbi:hypothetical protein BOX15_Mlig006942g1 [Macrostomum lignano]|uniref:HMG box domain-containing protein n=1 Tax=Macrostomum lignano TaxID=282301 RepID=A0A267F319_9PLAT|nr:hypothetical protein BOX15_Mlig006942g1 [Macrostomum lignano]